MDYGQTILPGESGGIPQDDTMMQLELKRKLALADALKNAQMPEGQMVSGRYVAPSWTQYLANAVGKYQGGKQEQEAMKQYGQFQQAKQAKLADLLAGKEVNEAGNMPGMTQTTRQPYSQQEFMAKAVGAMPDLAPELVKNQLASYLKDKTPIKGSAGDVFFDPTTHEQIFAVPPKEDKTVFSNLGKLTSELQKIQEANPNDPRIPQYQAAIAKEGNISGEKSNAQKEFEFAQSQGFKGSFNDFKNQMTPYQKAELDLRRKDLANKEGGKFDDATLNMLADQALAGDKSVFTGLGRGNQGANNIAAVRQRINQKMIDRGMNGADIAAKNAEFMGQLAGARAVGTRGANVELAGSGFQNIVPIAQAASDKVSRSGFLPFGKAEIMFNEQTNNPDLSAFAAANNGLVNTYARAISPTGIPTVKDKEHAYKILSMAKDKPAYDAAVSTLQKEIQAEIAAPKHVREMQRQEISGRGTTPNMPSSDDIAAEIARRQGRR